MSKINLSKVVPEIVESSIHTCRGQNIMLDIDLARLYGIETGVLNQAVKRNLSRFPADFMFTLTESEERVLRSQIVIAKRNLSSTRRRSLAHAFTEQGIAMLSSILRSDRAIQVNIQIMRTFTKLRELLLTNAELKEKIDALESKYDGQFRDVFEAIHVLIAEGSKP